jgi:hypothetical protein
MNLTANQWNNVSVTSYLTEPTFTVQFLGGAESGDTNQDSWSIDASLIHTWDLTATTLTIGCDPSIVDKTAPQTTTIGGYLTSADSGVSSKTVKLYYQGGASGPNVPPADGTWTYIAQSITGDGGYYSYVWDPPETLANGYYWIKAEFEGDADYGPSSKTTGVDLVSNLFVIPEYVLGTILALAVCFAGVAVYRKSRPLKRKIS